MKLSKEELLVLYEKFMSGKYTDEDLKALEEYQSEFQLTDSDWMEEMGDREEVQEELLYKIQQDMHKRHDLRIAYIKRLKFLAAAMVICVLSVTLYFYVKQPDMASVSQVVTTDVKPGGTKAVLRLEDGSEIVLDNAKPGLLNTNGNGEVEKNADGSIIYGAEDNSAKVVRHVVSTPAGGEYQIVLPDGTRVWLNASSSIKFPTRFVGDNRQVELTGEAYFEVTENKKMPFKVALPNGGEVKVLGTHFNIMSYSDEASVKTTLLSGAVEVSNKSGKKFLKPGDQAAISRKDGSMNVEKVDVNNVVAWKEGYFIFRNEDIYNIMRQISRWYDVEVVFQGNLSNRNFMGTISRSKNISEVLKVMEITDVIHFKVEGRRVTVMP